MGEPRATLVYGVHMTEDWLISRFDDWDPLNIDGKGWASVEAILDEHMCAGHYEWSGDLDGGYCEEECMVFVLTCRTVGSRLDVSYMGTRLEIPRPNPAQVEALEKCARALGIPDPKPGWILTAYTR